MQITEFKSIVKTFADPGSELLFDNTDFGISINGDLITAKVTAKMGDVFVDEGSGAEPASKWIRDRLARLPLLANRLRENLPATEHFVSPIVSLLPTLESGPDEKPVKSDDSCGMVLKTLEQRSPLETMVLYITSDAGEGKTSLINELARKQAQLFIDKKSDWLLVPIPLGGRQFLRFDDITVGVLQNRYRFPFLYDQSFLALVKMGVIIPAYDGFEEMFVETSSGEALSAMGVLVGALDSLGAMVVAARKAYFEFENLQAQERLYDSIKSYSVGFGKLELHRWAQPQFINYCRNRDVDNPTELYQRLKERLGDGHALLTRAVLVKKLVDLVGKCPSLDSFFNQLHSAGADYLSVFVREVVDQLIIRESGEKWLDRDLKDGVGTPLLTVDEHCELLSQIALAMWEARVDHLKRDTLEFVADYFCETTRKNAPQAQQVRARIRGHALLVTSANSPNAIEFDHDEFRLYFLGEGIAQQIRPMNAKAKAEVLATFRRGVIPADAILALVRSLTRNERSGSSEVIKFLFEVSDMDAQASYTRENIAELVIRLLSGIDGNGIIVTGQTFSHNALRDKKITGVIFQNCYFSATSLDLTDLNDCKFIGCNFVHLTLAGTTVVSGVDFQDCTIDALASTVRDREFWNPIEIRQQLENAGFTFLDASPAQTAPTPVRPLDPEIIDIEKLVRYFMRSTHMSESVIRIKLSGRGQTFISETLPRLLKCGVLVEIPNIGAGDQQRFRLGVTLQAINDATATADGDFEQFLAQFN